MTADLEFYFDPVCPFAWMTSKWVRQVASRRTLEVEWRFISLRLVNAEVDYASHFPPGYKHGHTAGLQLLRVAEKSAGLARSARCTRPTEPRSSTASLGAKKTFTVTRSGS